jgi:hypothetical protein
MSHHPNPDHTTVATFVQHTHRNRSHSTLPFLYLTLILQVETRYQTAMGDFPCSWPVAPTRISDALLVLGSTVVLCVPTVTLPGVTLSLHKFRLRLSPNASNVEVAQEASYPGSVLAGLQGQVIKYPLGLRLCTCGNPVTGPQT